MATSTPTPARLGHVGLHVTDLERAKEFYRDVVGLQITDEDPHIGMVFMSAQPEEEHHELLLARDEEKASASLQQISFYCGSLAELKEFHRRFQENGIRFDRVVTHGNAIGIYVHDPEDNIVEVYWHTGVEWPQPFGRPMDLTRPDEEILAALTTGMAQPAATS